MSTSSFDLDALEKEGRPDPLSVTVHGRVFTLRDPLLIPWTEYDTLDWSDLRAVLPKLLSADEFEAFMALNVSQHAMNILAERIGNHYMPGESGGSPAS